MSLLWHLIVADLRQHRWIIAAWVGLVIGGSATAAILPKLELGRGPREAVEIAKTLYGVSGVLLGTLLVGLVLHSHGTVGTRAFWLTRPFPAWMVISAKSVLLGTVFIALPTVAEATRAVLGGIAWAHAATVGGWFALVLTLWLALAAAAAAATGSLTRYVLVLCSGVVVVALTIAVSVAIQMSRLEEVTYVAVATPVRSGDGDLLFVSLTILAGVGVVVVQYLTRLRRYSTAVGVTLLAAALVIPDLWPWQLLAPSQRAAPWVDDARPSFTIDTDSVSTRDRWWSPQHDGQWRQVSGDLRLQGVEDGWAVLATTLEASATFPSGEVLRSPVGSGGQPRLAGVDGDATTVAVRNALDVERLFDAENPSGSRFTLMMIRDEDLARVAPAVASYTGRLQLMPVRYAVEGRMPVRVGSRHSSDRYRIELLEVRRMTGGLTARVRVDHGRVADAYHQYYLRNVPRDEAVAASADALITGFTAPLGLELSGFSSQQLQLTFPRRYPSDPKSVPPFEIDDEWLAKAELVSVRVTPAAPVERQLRVPSFPIKQPEPEDNPTRTSER